MCRVHGEAQVVKIETQDLPDSEVALSFEVEDARVERAIDAAYRRVANRVNIAGFRRGKAPRPLVERVVGKESLLQEALDHLLPEVYVEALRETNLPVLTAPEFEVESVEPLRAKATVVVRPPVELGDYRAIHRDPPDVSVAPEEVDSVLQQLREHHAEWIPVERLAEMGDLVAIDVVGSADGESLFKQEDVEYVLRADSTAPAPGFADQIVGMSAGETRSFDLDAPADAEDRPAGKSITFQVSLRDVKAKELPELDDYFATTVGSYGNLQELSARLEEQLRERAEQAARLALQEQVLDEAIASTTLTIPKRLLDQETQNLRDRLLRDLDSRSLTIEQYQRIRRVSNADLDAELRTNADRSLKRRFTLESIAAREGLEFSDQEISAEIRDSLQADRADERTIERAVQRPEIRDRVRTAMIDREALRWLVDHATNPASAAPAESAADATQGDTS
ncbi:MAG: trigger factor [Chloroflexi bacterium]|nr:trigger factor [Chloroflexota bacterium]